MCANVSVTLNVTLNGRFVRLAADNDSHGFRRYARVKIKCGIIITHDMQMKL